MPSLGTSRHFLPRTSRKVFRTPSGVKHLSAFRRLRKRRKPQGDRAGGCRGRKPTAFPPTDGSRQLFGGDGPLARGTRAARRSQVFHRPSIVHPRGLRVDQQVSHRPRQGTGFPQALERPRRPAAPRANPRMRAPRGLGLWPSRPEATPSRVSEDPQVRAEDFPCAPTAKASSVRGLASRRRASRPRRASRRGPSPGASP